MKAEAMAREQALDKRELFVRPGDLPGRFGMVIEGVFRAFRVTPGGEESVKAFRAEGEWVGAYSEMLQGIKSMTAIEALEPSRVLVFNAAQLQSLEDGHVCWIKLSRRVAEYHFTVKERREQEFLELSAEERWLSFWSENPHLEGRVPQREVAAYLGITEVALSRIVSRLKRRSK